MLILVALANQFLRIFLENKIRSEQTNYTTFINASWGIFERNMRVVIFWIMCQLSLGHEKKALLIAEATNPVRRSKIGPLKREDGVVAINDKDKANLMNDFFANTAYCNVANVGCGIPQGSILGPTLFVLYTNDLPSSISSGSVFMYADDTTVYCIDDNVENAVMSLNAALTDLNRWCQNNSLTPYSRKCQAMLLKKLMIGPLNLVYIGRDRIEWVNHNRLLGVTIDDRLSWSQHLTDVKKKRVSQTN